MLKLKLSRTAPVAVSDPILAKLLHMIILLLLTILLVPFHENCLQGTLINNSIHPPD